MSPNETASRRPDSYDPDGAVDVLLRALHIADVAHTRYGACRLHDLISEALHLLGAEVPR